MNHNTVVEDLALNQFFDQFETNESCISHFKAFRERNGLVCKKCGSEQLDWISTQLKWECRCCKSRTTLRSGTILQHSHLEFIDWYRCLYVMLVTQQEFSAVQMQEFLGRKRYEPIWFMMYKIESAVEDRGGKSALPCKSMDEALQFTVRKTLQPSGQR